MITDFGIGLVIGAGIAVILAVIIVFLGLADWINSGSH